MRRVFLLLAFIVVFSQLASGSALAAHPCAPVKVVHEGTEYSARVALVRVDCAFGQEIVVQYYELLEEDVDNVLPDARIGGSDVLVDWLCLNSSVTATAIVNTSLLRFVPRIIRRNGGNHRSHHKGGSSYFPIKRRRTCARRWANVPPSRLKRPTLGGFDVASRSVTVDDVASCHGLWETSRTQDVAEFG